MVQYFNIRPSYDKALFDAMFEAYKDKIIIPEQSKESYMYFYIENTGIYLFIDDFRNPEDIINQKLDNISDMQASYNGYEIEFCAECVSGKSWTLYKVLI